MVVSVKVHHSRYDADSIGAVTGDVIVSWGTDSHTTRQSLEGSRTAIDQKLRDTLAVGKPCLHAQVGK